MFKKSDSKQRDLLVLSSSESNFLLSSSLNVEESSTLTQNVFTSHVTKFCNTEKLNSRLNYQEQISRSSSPNLSFEESFKIHSFNIANKLNPYTRHYEASELREKLYLVFDSVNSMVDEKARTAFLEQYHNTQTLEHVFPFYCLCGLDFGYYNIEVSSSQISLKTCSKFVTFQDQSAFTKREIQKIGFCPFLSSEGISTAMKISWFFYKLLRELSFVPILTQLIAFLLLFLEEERIVVFLAYLFDTEAKLFTHNDRSKFFVIQTITEHGNVLKEATLYLKKNQRTLVKHLDKIGFEAHKWLSEAIAVALIHELPTLISLNLYFLFCTNGSYGLLRFFLAWLTLKKDLLLLCKHPAHVKLILNVPEDHHGQVRFLYQVYKIYDDLQCQTSLFDYFKNKTISGYQLLRSKSVNSPLRNNSFNFDELDAVTTTESETSEFHYSSYCLHKVSNTVSIFKLIGKNRNYNLKSQLLSYEDFFYLQVSLPDNLIGKDFSLRYTTNKNGLNCRRLFDCLSTNYLIVFSCQDSIIYSLLLNNTTKNYSGTPAILYTNNRTSDKYFFSMTNIIVNNQKATNTNYGIYFCNP